MNCKGQGATTGAIVLIVVVAVMCILGPLVYAYIRNAMTTPMSTLASTTFNNTVAQVDANVSGGFNLMSVSPIVIAAVAIIGIVLLLKAVA